MPTFETEDIGTFVALGGTFSSHQEEKNRRYRWPDAWVVPDAAVVPEGAAIEIPDRVEEVKPASELTAVIGAPIHRASESEAWDAIEGFTVSNDVTAAGDWPGWSDPDHGMVTGVGYKILTTFSPILTEYRSKGEVDDYVDLDVEVRVDGQVSVSGSTNQMAFGIGEMVSFASHITPLEPNDVVALGDPGNPRRTLDDAESVTASVESIGMLENPIRRV
ncbi:fumarylacetoacetate hydrolase family protein [Halomicroarcula sp. GCM10025817]|uniref:fumarylacetoacetate hydrolase family protein n=1 Tax=Haloarcula TaxID=2237 RepID=UPI0023E8511A|nr:fumarylacetoacetate hydrolase family protein [Halomicroarcula sp. SYNS111]